YSGKIQIAVSHQTTADRNRGPEAGTQVLCEAVSAQGFDKQGKAGQTITVDLRADMGVAAIDALNLALTQTEPRGNPARLPEGNIHLSRRLQHANLQTGRSRLQPRTVVLLLEGDIGELKSLEQLPAFIDQQRLEQQ